MQQAPSIHIPAPPPAGAAAIPRSSVSWLLVVTIMGYAPIGLLGSFIGYSVSPYFRAVEVLLSAYVFLRYLPGPHTWGRHLWLHAFLGLYLLRLLFDTVIGAPGDPGTSLVFFLAVVVGPTLALSGVRPANIDWDATAWRLVQRRGWWRRILLTAAGALCAQALLMSASRGPMVALGVSLAVYVVATRRFFWPLLLVAVGGFLLFSQEDSILLARFLLLVQYFVNGQISGSIWGSDAMWALTAVVLAYGAKRAQTSRAGLRSASGTRPWSPSSYTR